MNKKLFLLISSLFATFCLSAQLNDSVAFYLNDRPVYKYELTYAYLKANENFENKLTIQDFIPSYIEFKMNVEEARAQHLDTLSRYKREYRLYRQQMSVPYMTDTIIEEAYTKKVYDRLLENIELNHIIIPFKKNIILPSDTVDVYNEAIKVRGQVIRDGFTDEIIRNRELISDSALGLERKNGYLGWVAALMLPANIENAIYNMPIGEISQPIRTAGGYHIVQVLDKRTAVGAAEIEQVMFRFGHIPASQQEIDSVRNVAWKEYNNVRATNSFQILCEEFSHAYKTGDQGCYFGIVGLDSKLSPEFLSAVFSLDNLGDISEPVISDYGFHIVRLLKKIPVQSYEKMKRQLQSKITDGNRRYELSREKKNQTKNKVNLTVNENAYAELDNIAVDFSPQDSLFLTKIKNHDEILINLDDKRAIPVKEFVRYIEYRQKLLRKQNVDELEMLTVVDPSPYSLSTDILKEYFNSFTTIIIDDYIEDILEDLHFEFKQIINEFSDELLVYEIKNRNIWERAKTDENGLANTFDKNKNKYKLDSPRYKGIIIHAKTKQALQSAESLVKKRKPAKELLLDIKKQINTDSVLVKLEPGLWRKGDNPYIDYKIYAGSEPYVDNRYPYFSVIGNMINKPENFGDVKNAVEEDYRKELEKEWSAYLKDKYKVKINQSVIETIR